uniref:Endonuclease n=1 Tax=Laodelphax striatellus TaxID=195883 RepID=A0A219LW50_LAOST|nr:DNA/RNA non-specific endonuclease [Laodelphax striatellus]
MATNCRFRSLVKTLGSYSLIGAGGWVFGTYCERYKENECIATPRRQKSVPGLPIFGSVSAAVPISTSGNDIAVKESESRVSQIMKYGFPSLANIRSLDDYILSYDTRNRVAYWVFEHMSSDRLKPNNDLDRNQCSFIEDDSVHKYFRSTNADYKGSGFDRGHLAAAGNHRISQKHLQQTFLLSNMAPQVGPGFNRDAWNSLEKHVRKLTKLYKNVYVCTGPLFLPKKESDGKSYVKYQVIGPNNVAVPTHFFKVAVMETADNKLHMEAYVMPNQPIDSNTPLFAFQVPPDSIERASGLLFFDKMNRNNLVQINGKKTTFI